jgi:hypothetical protein
VLNQNRSLTAVSPSELFEEAKVRSGIEGIVLAIVEPCAPKLDGTEKLRVLAFSASPGLPVGIRRDSRWRGWWNPAGLASSVKMSAQCRERALFKGWIDAAAPSVLRRGIGAHRRVMGPLHGKYQAVQQFAHISQERRYWHPQRQSDRWNRDSVTQCSRMAH